MPVSFTLWTYYVIMISYYHIIMILFSTGAHRMFVWYCRQWKDVTQHHIAMMRATEHRMRRLANGLLIVILTRPTHWLEQLGPSLLLTDPSLLRSQQCIFANLIHVRSIRTLTRLWKSNYVRERRKVFTVTWHINFLKLIRLILPS